MDRKYGTLDLPKRTEQMKGIYLKNVISTSHKALHFEFNTNTDFSLSYSHLKISRLYIRLITNRLKVDTL